MALNEDQIANAIGICASRSNPLLHLDAHNVELSMTKNLRFGFVCYDAILACTLARKGFPGPTRFAEGATGLAQGRFKTGLNLAGLTDFTAWRMPKARHRN